MMKRFLIAFLTAGVVILGTVAPGLAQQQTHQLGIGGHYWTTINNIDVDNIDENGFSYLVMYQYHYDWIGLGVNLEWFERGFAGAEEDVIQPQAFLIVGKVIYAAAGIGGYYTDGQFADDVFYALRAGLDIELLPILHLDINANYRFENWDDLSTEGKSIDTDTVTLGAAARLVF